MSGSDIIALFALVMAGLTLLYSKHQADAARIQADKATEAVKQTERLASGNAVMHFTDRFFELIKEGEPFKKLLDNPDWAYQFWSLQATEFYFFHHRLLPTFMYSLWMVDLASLYAGTDGEKIRHAHCEYLNKYARNYTDMFKFFEGLYDHAQEQNASKRNRAIARWIDDWADKNCKSEIS